MADLRQSFNLTPTEERVARLILSGSTAKAIAARLRAAESTIAVHVKHILSKSGTRRQADFIRHVAILDGWDAEQYVDADIPEIGNCASGGENAIEA